MRFAAGFALGIAVTLIGQTQVDQMERHSHELYCEQHLFDSKCMP
jgi:hypothetical protein